MLFMNYRFRHHLTLHTITRFNTETFVDLHVNYLWSRRSYLINGLYDHDFRFRDNIVWSRNYKIHLTVEIKVFNVLKLDLTH